jgi:hypothetical protein
VNWPSTREEWVAGLAKAGWVLSRLQFFGIIVGAIVTLTIQMLTGFWDFREKHQELIRKQYEAVQSANTQFQQEMVKFTTVFDKQQVGFASDDYARAAQAYIGTLQDAARLLPSTKPELDRYVNALSLLNTYYSNTSPPARGTQEWMVFFGNFRLDLDRYIKARDSYLDKLASELGDYRRYLANS